MAAKKKDSFVKKPKKFDKKAEDFLSKYLNNYAPTGFESPGQKIWMKYLKPYVDEFITDTYGTAVGVINPGKKYSVVIEAHSDEIAWYVNYITEKGYIYVARNGGSDHQIAPSMRVDLHGEKGLVPGVFGWPAIHVRRDKEQPPKMDNIFVDVGAESKDEVLEMGIDVGTVITFKDGLTEMNNRYLVGRALDNRLGGFAIAQVARQIKENKIKLPYTLYVVNAVQEEIGLRGAEMISRRLKPNAAIIVDVTHDTNSPMYNKKIHGDVACGKGPSVSVAPAIQNNLLKLMTDTAKKKKIPLQREARSRGSGTDTDAFAYSGEGVASALISIPLKYMHTTVETVHREDVHNTIKLFTEVLKNIKGKESFSYFD